MKDKLEYRHSVTKRELGISFLNYIQAVIRLNSSNGGLWRSIKFKPYKNACIYLTTSMLMFESAEK